MAQQRYEAGFGMPEGPDREAVRRLDRQIVWGTLIIAVIALILSL